FVIAGEGPDEAELRRLSERLGLVERVTFAGLPSENRPYFEVLDVYCQTNRAPSSGRELARALTHGVPCIATEVGGLRSVTTARENVFPIPPGAPAAPARSVLELLNDRPSAHELGRRGRERIAQECDPDRAADELAALYPRLLAGDDPIRRASNRPA